MRSVHVYETPGRYVLLRGPITQALKGFGIPAVRSRVQRGYQLRTERLADTVARFQSEGWAVRIHEGEPND